MKKLVRKNSCAYEILKKTASASGGIIAFSALFVAPGLALVLPPIMKGVRDWKRDKRIAQELAQKRRIQEAIKRLREKRLVRHEECGKKTYIVITKHGRQEVKRFDFENLAIQQPDNWDKRWRLVIFDIPEKFKKGRWALRDKLLELGFYPLQKSVFAYPYDCNDEIDFITRFCDVENFVCYLICGFVGNKEIVLRKHFSLL